MGTGHDHSHAPGEGHHHHGDHDHHHRDLADGVEQVYVDPAEEATHHRGMSEDSRVVMDIGGDIGAVTVTVPADLVGLEIDIVGLEPGTLATHGLVRERRLPDGRSVWAAVIPGLPAGSYRIPAVGPHPETPVQVEGGRVAEVDWS